MAHHRPTSFHHVHRGPRELGLQRRQAGHVPVGIGGLSAWNRAVYASDGVCVDCTRAGRRRNGTGTHELAQAR
jgi:hypothetical protein